MESTSKFHTPFSLLLFTLQFPFLLAFPLPPFFHLTLLSLSLHSSLRPSSAGESGVRREEPEDAAKGKRALRILQLAVSSRATHLDRLREGRVTYHDLQQLAPADKTFISTVQTIFFQGRSWMIILRYFGFDYIYVCLFWVIKCGKLI